MPIGIFILSTVKIHFGKKDMCLCRSFRSRNKEVSWSAMLLLAAEIWLDIYLPYILCIPHKTPKIEWALVNKGGAKGA